MIIYGSRMYFKKDVVHGYEECEHCGNFTQNISYTARKFGHIYFIPLFPSGPKVRVLMECKSCNFGRSMPVDTVPAFLKEVTNDTMTALQAMLEGKETFLNQNEEVNALAYIKNTVSLLLSLHGDEVIHTVLEKIQAKGLLYEHALILGEEYLFKGKMSDAANSFRAAIEQKPEDAFAHLALAEAYLFGGNPKAAQPVFEKTLILSHNSFTVLKRLLGVYEMTKEFEKMAQTYEAIFEQFPNLKADNNLVKAYKKVCKKAKRQPIGV